MTSVLVTGGSGFVGRSLLAHLAAQEGYVLQATLRSPDNALPAKVCAHLVAGLGPATDWSAALTDVEVLIHTAARVHVMHEQHHDPLAEYRLANVEGTLQLARQAKSAGVRRFIYLSSIKVNGEYTAPGEVFRADDIPAPQDAYGLSKWEAECALRELCRDGSMELVIIRPVLIYGPGVKANFLSMLRWVERGVPLPLASLTSRRSLLGLNNLLDFIQVCMHHRAAANQTFLASDGYDLSIPELLRHIARAMNKSCRLLPVPSALLRLAANCVGREAMAQRLLSALRVDISKNQQLLQWAPPHSIEQEIERTVQAYLDVNKQ